MCKPAEALVLRKHEARLGLARDRGAEYDQGVLRICDTSSTESRPPRTLRWLHEHDPDRVARPALPDRLSRSLGPTERYATPASVYARQHADASMSFSTGQFSRPTIEHAVCTLTISDPAQDVVISDHCLWRGGMPTAAAATSGQSGGQAGRKRSRREDGSAWLSRLVSPVCNHSSYSSCAGLERRRHLLVCATARSRWVEHAVLTLPGTN